MKKTNKKIDLLLTFSLVILGALICLFFNLKPLFLGILITIPPSFYLIFREKKNFLKIFWAIILIGFVAAFIFDFIETFNEAWFVEKLVIPWRIFGVLPLDDVAGFMMMTFFIIVFYEHFLDDEKNKTISRNLKKALIPALIILIFVLTIYFINPSALKFPYAYIVGGVLR